MKKTAKVEEQENFKHIKGLVQLATVTHIKNMITKYISESVERDFLLWILADNNLYRDDYLQITGVTKISELSSFLVYDLFEIKKLEELTFFLGALNAFFFFEIVSDNLAIGLANTDKENIDRKLQEEVLLYFNNVMQKKLVGNSDITQKMLLPKMQQIQQISYFLQSLFPGEIKKFAQLYESTCDGLVSSNIEHSTETFLVLNIAACRNLIDIIADPLIKPHLIQNLMLRYQSGSELLQNKFITDRGQLLKHGTKTILVMPVMLYIAAAVNSIVPNRTWEEIIENGLLLKTAEMAACLVRISNDIGTPLAVLTKQELDNLQKEITLQYQQELKVQSSLSFLEFLNSMTVEAKYIAFFARIRKDLKHNEFNISLDPIRDLKDGNKACELFLNNLQYYSEFYQEQRSTFLQHLEEMTDYLQNENISQIILRMVIFHEKLYQHSFENSHGEFATKR